MSFMRARRQNHSCDQCRRSKKACDGYLVNNRERPGFSLDPQDEVLPCSYCVKTKKQCSLNVHWTAQNEASASSGIGGFSDEMGGIDNRDDCISTNSGGTSGLLQRPSPNSWALNWGTSPPRPGEAVSGDTSSHLFDAGSGQEIDLHTGADNFALGSTTAPMNLPQLAKDHSSIEPDLDSLSQGTDFDHLTTVSGTFHSHSMPINSGYSMQSAYHRRDILRKNYRTRRCSDNRPGRLSTSTSPNGTVQGMMTRFNSHLITENLLQIYHDVLENNFACWLSENICPYKMQSRRTQLCHHPGRDASATSEQGTVVFNSVYSRVKHLDRIAQSTGLIQLTYAESQATSKALNLVIMAFATQWSQGRRRREEMFSASLNPLDPAESEGMADESTDEFEESFQYSFWEQAKQALQDVADLESYRVVYAELIFGLIQRPWATTSHSKTSIAGLSNSTFTDMKVSLPQIMEIISQDGPPVFTERASRKMQVLKCHFESNESGVFRYNNGFPAQQQNHAVSKITLEERTTIGQLYWLAVMFDTVSSSMNERPVVVADEDCQHEATYSSSNTVNQPVNYRWDLELFAQDNTRNPSTLIWPCSYDSAVQAVTKSAAVKVLLFRYVSYLQNALRKRERSPEIEEIIMSAMQIYKYWNLSHGTFFRSLIKNYESVPVRIKSWFPCIHIPWHLGALMLADLIEFVDQNGLGIEENSLNRLSINMAVRIRKSSALELSDLARVTIPREIGNMPEEQLPGFHFAVNEGSILTEPWTVLLIRAFTKASIYHLSAAENLQRQEWDILGQESEEYGETLARADACIKALWFLGRKSEMARRLSKVLDGVLGSKKAKHIYDQTFSERFN
ncbi:hypothetical protein RRF57_007990 [Xylaria bambusicola]|uniref:Zn(2)-C6 fungal-type domain-containing protein n=1 Tax=Xylaria bambusicola TaxID=326684 RepID=A0AAN7UUJ2_9PEZI